MDLLADIESFIHRDPAMRGLISSEDRFGRLCAGHFPEAVKELAKPNLTVGIVTGFYVPSAGAAETDGPPGAIRLALALKALGQRVLLLTDQLCGMAIEVAAQAMGFPKADLRVFPDSDPSQELAWMESLAETLTHLVAIERVGPSHTRQSFARQTHEPNCLAEFLEHVPDESRGCCHNMRGENIDAWTGGLHRLFDWVAKFRPQVCTIGVGDGGNEIGMGCLTWEDITRRLLGSNAALIPCRVATDWNLIAGTSNWGGYALAAGVLALCDQVEVMQSWTCEREEELLKHLVINGPLVDGVTRLPQATVDGLPFWTYIQAWAAIRNLFELPE